MQAGKGVVLTAFACHPGMSSEAGIGWIFLKHLAESCQDMGIPLTAVMNERSAKSSGAELERLCLADNVEIIGLDPPQWLAFLRHPKLTRLEYLVWVRRARSLFAQRHRVVGDDSILAWHVTFASEILPVPFASPKMWPGSTKVWGPVGSSGSPVLFLARPHEGSWLPDAILQLLRNALAGLIATRTARGMSLVLTQSPELADRLGSHRAELFPNVVIPEQMLPPRDVGADSTQHDVPRLLAAGHLVPRKRLGLLLAALREPSLQHVQLDIAGRPLPGVSDYLPALATRLGVQDRVRFLGKLPRDELLRIARDYDVFVHPAAREGAPGVVGEMAMQGLPIACFKGTGAAAVLEASGGHGVAVDPSLDAAAALAEGVRRAIALGRVPESDYWREARIQAFIRRQVERHSS
jgi:glycosyltransferase involved in cell wall biosynthesis